jgi:hypothetical protein
MTGLETRFSQLCSWRARSVEGFDGGCEAAGLASDGFHVAVQGAEADDAVPVADVFVVEDEIT